MNLYQINFTASNGATSTLTVGPYSTELEARNAVIDSYRKGRGFLLIVKVNEVTTLPYDSFMFNDGTQPSDWPDKITYGWGEYGGVRYPHVYNKTQHVLNTGDVRSHACGNEVGEYHVWDFQMHCVEFLIASATNGENVASYARDV